MECCQNPNIYNSDFRRVKGGPIIQNRHCSRCGTHWYAGRKFTKKQWDDYLESPPEINNLLNK